MTSDHPGRALFAFVRRFGQLPGRETVSTAQGRLALVAEAVDALTSRGADATVNAVAAHLGIDQSGASRLLRTATEAGVVRTDVSSADARRRTSVLTPAGESMLAEALTWQDEVLARLTAQWSEDRRADFLSDLGEIVAAADRLGL
ncbi:MULTISPECIES: MarR family winged helix-turn-helix transcriptional regulator [unclassified Brevibacterium]|uniref:MarR family winged helix-turn-helix transcriptional regulator n=1 Tax=unclassified Brevibacterium TaxID=2614124 RepID=UPI0010F64E57|nr:MULTISPECIES: MarR family winged helix-turn-helix transcriptional regulator [unclassified Brevibacterium]MCM1012773.1 MarR family winged helix-turn-helix transcriptional regulator [Brevibacterium sp. XM4083]